MSGRLALIHWDPPGPYAVAFSTRIGGVSELPFDSLNLGILTGDDPSKVIENRIRLCRELGAEPERATMARQRHGARVVRAQADRGVVIPEFRHPPADGLWSDEPGRAMLLVTADCLPVALARANGERPALAVLHVGWRGLLAGIAATGVAALGAEGPAGAIGPGIGPCCYEVGEEVAAPLRTAFGADVVRDGRLDLWTAAERALRRAGCATVERTDLCTACHPELFFSHRRDAGRTGRQGVLGYVA